MFPWTQKKSNHMEQMLQFLLGGNLVTLATFRAVHYQIWHQWMCERDCDRTDWAPWICPRKRQELDRGCGTWDMECGHMSLLWIRCLHVATQKYISGVGIETIRSKRDWRFDDTVDLEELSSFRDRDTVDLEELSSFRDRSHEWCRYWILFQLQDVGTMAQEVGQAPILFCKAPEAKTRIPHCFATTLTPWMHSRDMELLTSRINGWTHVQQCASGSYSIALAESAAKWLVQWWRWRMQCSYCWSTSHHRCWQQHWGSNGNSY